MTSISRKSRQSSYGRPENRSVMIQNNASNGNLQEIYQKKEQNNASLYVDRKSNLLNINIKPVNQTKSTASKRQDSVASLSTCQKTRTNSSINGATSRQSKNRSNSKLSRQQSTSNVPRRHATIAASSSITITHGKSTVALPCNRSSSKSLTRDYKQGDQLQGLIQQIYTEVCADQHQYVIQRIKNGFKIDESGIIRLECNASINDQTISGILMTVKRARKILPQGTISGLSFSKNPSFNDSSLIQLISFMERQKKCQSNPSNVIRGLYLENLNCSQPILFKLCSAIQNFENLLEVSISGNKLPYFCIDALVNCQGLPQGLRLSNTQMDEMSAFSLIQKLVKSGSSKNAIGVRQLDLSQNPLLGYPFYKQLFELIKYSPPSILQTIDLRMCSISETCLVKLGKLVTLASSGVIAQSSSNLLKRKAKSKSREVTIDASSSHNFKKSKQTEQSPSSCYNTSSFNTIDIRTQGQGQTIDNSSFELDEGIQDPSIQLQQYRARRRAQTRTDFTESDLQIQQQQRNDQFIQQIAPTINNHAQRSNTIQKNRQINAVSHSRQSNELPSEANNFQNFTSIQKNRKNTNLQTDFQQSFERSRLPREQLSSQDSRECTQNNPFHGRIGKSIQSSDQKHLTSNKQESQEFLELPTDNNELTRNSSGTSCFEVRLNNSSLVNGQSRASLDISSQNNNELQNCYLPQQQSLDSLISLHIQQPDSTKSQSELAIQQPANKQMRQASQAQLKDVIHQQCIPIEVYNAQRRRNEVLPLVLSVSTIQQADDPQTEEKDYQRISHGSEERCKQVPGSFLSTNNRSNESRNQNCHSNIFSIETEANSVFDVTKNGSNSQEQIQSGSPTCNNTNNSFTRQYQNLIIQDEQSESNFQNIAKETPQLPGIRDSNLTFKKKGFSESPPDQEARIRSSQDSQNLFVKNQNEASLDQSYQKVNCLQNQVQKLQDYIRSFHEDVDIATFEQRQREKGRLNTALGDVLAQQQELIQKLDRQYKTVMRQENQSEQKFFENELPQAQTTLKSQEAQRQLLLHKLQRTENSPNKPQIDDLIASAASQRRTTKKYTAEKSKENMKLFVKQIDQRIGRIQRLEGKQQFNNYVQDNLDREMSQNVEEKVPMQQQKQQKVFQVIEGRQASHQEQQQQQPFEQNASLTAQSLDENRRAFGNVTNFANLEPRMLV